MMLADDHEIVLVPTIDARPALIGVTIVWLAIAAIALAVWSAL